MKARDTWQQVRAISWTRNRRSGNGNPNPDSGGRVQMAMIWGLPFFGWGRKRWESFPKEKKKGVERVRPTNPKASIPFFDSVFETNCSADYETKKIIQKTEFSLSLSLSLWFRMSFLHLLRHCYVKKRRTSKWAVMILFIKAC